MRIRTLIDFIVQSLIIVPVVIFSIAFVLMRQLESIGMVAIYGALFLGPWQLVGSLITTIARRPFFTLRLIHLTTAGVYITLGSFLVQFFVNKEFNDFFTISVMVLGFGVPAVLALFYYYITFKTLQFYKK